MMFKLFFAFTLVFSCFSQIPKIDQSLSDCLLPRANSSDKNEDFYKEQYSNNKISIRSGSINGITPFKAKIIPFPIAQNTDCELVISNNLRSLADSLVVGFGSTFQYEINQEIIPYSNKIDYLFLRAMIFPVVDPNEINSELQTLLDALIDQELSIYLNSIIANYINEKTILELFNSNVLYSEIVVGMKLNSSLLSLHDKITQDSILDSSSKSVEFLPNSKNNEIVNARNISDHIKSRFDKVYRELKPQIIAKLQQIPLGFSVSELSRYKIEENGSHDVMEEVEDNGVTYLDSNIEEQSSESSREDNLYEIAQFCKKSEISLTHNALINSKEFTRTRYYSQDRLKKKLIEVIADQINLSFVYFYNTDLAVPTMVVDENTGSASTNSNYQFLTNSFFIGTR